MNELEKALLKRIDKLTDKIDMYDEVIRMICPLLLDYNIVLNEEAKRIISDNDGELNEKHKKLIKLSQQFDNELKNIFMTSEWRTVIDKY